ncbi:MAG: tyrosine-type recombinase/integrase, partial [Cypionkella sp.]
MFVNPTGSKLWQFKYRIDGKEKLLSIGVYPEVGLAMARARKDEARTLLAAGKGPGEAKKDQQRQERAWRGNTFEALALEFATKAAAEGRAASTQPKTEWLLGMANASFGQRPIIEISAPMILTCLRKVEAKGNHETAKRLLAKIGAVLKYAVAVGLAEIDPTLSLQGALIRPTPKPRAAITDADKLGGLLRAIDGALLRKSRLRRAFPFPRWA